ncbi:glycosyltransferase family 4 protein [Chelatococcus sambhunathii]|uniref:Glycosyltransferase family 4 protein n=1 Tax=Chelatococcus sambhunathii TaxID=363953 RepID=A0ABU1DEP4_9HYPH|nr:glycosyltransferase family 4 protein [Chelatococcus sambhunathii]MDR4306531.1 glycosyltransferase family 4 protein [Chelatococcus sambhunathii]
MDARLEEIVSAIGPRRVVVLSDRYPPDAAGGAELSLHLLMREQPLREQAVVVTFDKSLGAPERREVDGVDVIALPMSAAWPLHRLSQHEVDRLKRRRSGVKWRRFVAEAAALGVRNPRIHGPALALQLAGPPPGGIRMAHATVPEGRAQPEIRAILARVKPAVVHADNARSIMMAADALSGSDIPLVALVRDHRFTSLQFDQSLAPAPGAGGLSLRGRLAMACAKAALAYRQTCLRRASVVIVTSRHLAGTLEPVTPEGRLRRLPLEPVELPGHGLAARKNGFSILVVGSLTHNKGQLHFLRGWQELFARIPNARIDFAGRGATQAAMEAVIARNRLGDRVRLHGHLSGEALQALYRDCDVVALPTLWAEPFGRVPLEAGAAGRPVVAYASGGLVETVEDGVTGRLVERADRPAFIEALADLAGDREARQRMGEAGRARVIEAYAPLRLARLLAVVWDEVAGDAPSRIAANG